MVSVVLKDFDQILKAIDEALKKQTYAFMHLVFIFLWFKVEGGWIKAYIIWGLRPTIMSPIQLW